MNTYTIEYKYGIYKGIEIVKAETDDQAHAIMWKRLTRYTDIPLAYPNIRIMNIEYELKFT